MMIRVRFGDGHVERPLREVLLEALFFPAFLLPAWRAVRGGWGN